MSKFTKNRRWAVVKDLKGFPSHKQGGVDIQFGPDGVNLTNGQSTIKANNGLIIPNSFIPGLRGMYNANPLKGQQELAHYSGVATPAPNPPAMPHLSQGASPLYDNFMDHMTQRLGSNDNLVGKPYEVEQHRSGVQNAQPAADTKFDWQGALGKIAPALGKVAPYASAGIAAAGLAYKGYQALDRGPQSQYGMMAENNAYNVQGYNKGGAIGDQQLSSDAVKIQGNPQQVDGNYRQVEGSEGMFNHDEVVSKLPDGTNFAFSTKYKNPLTGNSISADAEENRKKAGKLEQKLEDNPADKELLRTQAIYDKVLTDLAELNTQMKQVEEKETQMQQNPQMMQGMQQQGMQQDPMQYLNGGEIPRFNDGGSVDDPTDPPRISANDLPKLRAAMVAYNNSQINYDQFSAIVAPIVGGEEAVSVFWNHNLDQETGLFNVDKEPRTQETPASKDPTKGMTPYEKQRYLKEQEVVLKYTEEATRYKTNQEVLKKQAREAKESIRAGTPNELASKLIDDAARVQHQLNVPPDFKVIREQIAQELEEATSYFDARAKEATQYLSKKDFSNSVSVEQPITGVAFEAGPLKVIKGLGLNRRDVWGRVDITTPSKGANRGEHLQEASKERVAQEQPTQQEAVPEISQTGGAGSAGSAGGSKTPEPSYPTKLVHPNTKREYDVKKFQEWIMANPKLSDAQKKEMLGASGADGIAGPMTQKTWEEAGGSYASTIDPAEVTPKLETLATPTSVTSQTAQTPQQAIQNYEPKVADESTGSNWKARIGDVLQGINVLGAFSGLAGGPEKEKLPRAANFQVSEIPQMNQARNAYNAGMRGASGGNYNTNRYMAQGMNANYMNQLSQIGQQTQQTNLGLAAQTNQMNTQIAAQQSDINARNRGAYDQAKQAAFATVGNVGQSMNDVKANNEAMAMMASQFGVYKYFQKDVEEMKKFMSENRE